MPDQPVRSDRLRAIRNLALEREAGAMQQALANGQVPSIVLKGISIARWLYPGELRPQGDVDLLVAPEDFSKAAELLKSVGFTDHGPPNSALNQRVLVRGHVVVDLHYRILGTKVTAQVAWDIWSQNVKNLRCGVGDLTVLSYPALAVHIGLHALQHGRSEPRPIEDLRRLVESDVDWEAVWDVASQLGASQRLSSSLALLGDVAAPLGQADLYTAVALGRRKPLSLGLIHFFEADLPSSRWRFAARKLMPRSDKDLEATGATDAGRTRLSERLVATASGAHRGALAVSHVARTWIHLKRRARKSAAGKDRR